MRRAIRPRMLLTLVTIVLAACTSGSGGSATGTSTPAAPVRATTAEPTPADTVPVTQPSAPATTEASPSPLVGTLPVVVNQALPVTPGTYVTAMQDPPMSISLPDQWSLFVNTADATGGVIQMNAGARSTGGINENVFVFDYFGKVISPEREDKVISTPDLVGFLQHNPHYEVIGGPSPVTVGGVQGTSIDIQAVDPPTCTYYSGDEAEACWNVMPMANADPFTPINREIGEMLVVGNVPSAPQLQDPARLVLVRVHGQDVIIEWNDKAPSFHSTLSTFQEFLDGVQWTSDPVVATPAPSASSSGPAAGNISVTSTLDGRTTLPQRIQWEGRPSSAGVEEVDFLIDGQPAWIEHNPPYVYGNDGNWLVTSFLQPGSHTFTTKAVGTTGQVATDTVEATVSPAPAPPPGLAATWARVVTDADVGKATSNEPPPAGRWRLTIDPAGWHLRDPRGGSAFFDVAYGDSGKVQMRPVIAHPPIGNPDTGGFCGDTDPLSAWSFAVDGGKLVLHPVGSDPCGDRAAILEGTWTRAGT
ncbi:MAG TPA: hypothetical protein VNN79_13405 [Actinomycetota bacterium]|nr:hypothetical protein [Actinomycetota bacterium]